MLSLWNGTTNTNLTVTLFDDADTPASAQYLGANIGMGYQTPQIYNYLPSPGGYKSLTDIGGTAVFTGNNFTFSLVAPTSSSSQEARSSSASTMAPTSPI